MKHQRAETGQMIVACVKNAIPDLSGVAKIIASNTGHNLFTEESEHVIARSD